jgi:tetratricopeptide (TPR) repeat protein
MLQTATTFGDRNIIVQVSGDNNVVTVHDRAFLTLTTFSPARSRPPAKDLDLLIPQSCAIPLIGRDNDQNSLRRWLSSWRPISVLTLTGPGGSGKTRLALETVLECLAASWDAGFVTHTELRRFIAAQNISTWGWQRDTFIVIDYAATLGRDLRTCLSELAQSVPTQPHKLRILLLERHADIKTGWYSEILPDGWERDDVQALFDPWEPLAIQPIADVRQRHEILRCTLERGASLRAAPVSPLPTLSEDRAFDRRLLDTQFSDPLMLMMAALTALDTGVPSALALSRREVALRLAAREAARLRRFAANDEHAADFLIHLAACVTVCGGLTHEQALSLAAQESEALHYQYPQGSLAVVRDLEKALPDADGIDGVRPDLIGEAFLMDVWKTQNPILSISRALEFSDRNVFSSLVRTAQDFADLKEIRPIVWLNLLVEQSSDYGRLVTLYDAMPTETICLRDSGHRVVSKLLSLGELIPNSHRPDLLFGLSTCQSSLGQLELALGSIREAVKLYRDLVATRTDAYFPRLSIALNYLAECQGALGEHEEALVSAQESVQIRRDLIAARPDRCQNDLVVPLNNLSRHQIKAGRLEQALANSEEAVKIGRDFAAGSDEALSRLANSLVNLSTCQSSLGQHEQAIVSVQEALEIYRGFAATRPDSYLPALAVTLSNLAAHQRGFGALKNCIENAQEAVKIQRHLVMGHPDSFLSNLATFLTSLGSCHSSLGQHEQAVASVQEAVDIYRGFAATRPAAYLPDLAHSLNNLSILQAKLGQDELAFESIRESVTIYRDLVVTHPAIRPDVARAISTLSLRQRDQGQHEHALECIHTAVRLFRDLAKTQPDAFRPDLASSLNNLSNCQRAVAQNEYASPAAKKPSTFIVIWQPPVLTFFSPNLSRRS